eukprot:Seg2674.3 transcript_id=Seg2674.3/GoldUCD/mRNA.D3Y31 product="Magnesium-dependent phosphatase 1" protein_id=Seg2674.3/GoldUCD/D3Y31
MNEIRAIFGKYDARELPKLFVFDLDYTLWPFWVDTEVDPPFTRFKDDVVDVHGTIIRLYRDVKDILKELKHSKCLIAAASRTETPKEAHDLLSVLGIDHFFDYKEIYPGKKTVHFSKFKQSSGINFNEMIFFDDEQRNIRDVGQLGVTCNLVLDGMSCGELEQGLEQHRSKFAHSR